MEKKVTQANAATATVDKPTLAFNGEITMAEYTDRFKVTRSYVKVVMFNPFEDEELGDVELICMFPKNKGIFELKAKKALKSADKISCTGYLTPASFENKNHQTYDYVGVFLKDPFFSGDIKMKIRAKDLKYAVAYLLSEKWGLDLFTYYNEVDENNGNLENEEAE